VFSQVMAGSLRILGVAPDPPKKPLELPVQDVRESV
jgi:hypothetical protein